MPGIYKILVTLSSCHFFHDSFVHVHAKCQGANKHLQLLLKKHAIRNKLQKIPVHFTALGGICLLIVFNPSRYPEPVRKCLAYFWCRSVTASEL